MKQPETEKTRRAQKPQKTLLIGELARLTGRSAHTLRYYESAGLIPGVGRDADGRRIYSQMHVGWLELLGRLRESGMSIRQMKAYAALVQQGERSLPGRQAILLDHAREVQRRIAELQDCLAIVHAKVAYYERWLASGRRPFRIPSARKRA